MQFEQVLADCIDRLEQGDSIAECLVRYPQQAQALLPMLELAAALRQHPKPRLSTKAFTQIRATLATQAQQAAAARPAPTTASQSPRVPALLTNGRYTQAERGNPTEVRHRTGGRQRADHSRQHRPASNQYTLSSPRPTTRTARRSVIRAISMGLTLCLLVGLFAFVRQVSISLPGAPLYGVKTVGEQVQGLLMTAAGDRAQWHAQQAALRIGELAQLPATQQSTAQSSTLAQSAASHIESALAAGATLPQTERIEFLTTWQADLQQLNAELQQAAVPATPAVETVQAALTAIALALTPTPTVLPLATEPTLPASLVPTAIATTGLLSPTLPFTPSLATATLGLLLTPTATLTATTVPTVSVILTVTPTPVLVPTATPVATASPTVVPTATQLPEIPQVMPREESSSRNEDENKDAEAAPAADEETRSRDNDSSEAEADPQTVTDDAVAGTPDDTNELVPTPTDETLTPVAPPFFTPTPLITVTPAEQPTADQTPIASSTPLPNAQPTLSVLATVTKIVTPIEEQPTAQLTLPPDPATAVATVVEINTPQTIRNATATPVPTRTPRPSATPEATSASRRTAEPTAQATAQTTATAEATEPAAP